MRALLLSSIGVSLSVISFFTGIAEKASVKFYGQLLASDTTTLSSKQLSATNSGDSLSIQYVDLKANKLLHQEISKFIQEQTDSSQLFRSGFGYVSIGGYTFDHPGPLTIDQIDSHKNDVVVSFNMHANSYFIYDDPSPVKTFGNAFPQYYSFIDNRLVLIYDSNAKWIHRNAFSKSSKQLVSELVRKTLLQVLDPDFEFKGMDKTSYFLSVDKRATMSERKILERAAFALNSGKTYIEYYDGRVSYRKSQ